MNKIIHLSVILSTIISVRLDIKRLSRLVYVVCFNDHGQQQDLKDSSLLMVVSAELGFQRSPCSNCWFIRMYHIF